MKQCWVILLGWFWWCVVPVRRREAVAAASRRGVTPDLVRRSVGSVALGYWELLWGGAVDWRGLEAARGGALLFTGHLGPWDICLVEAAKIAPLTVFLKVPSNPLAARAIARLRSQPGVDLQPLPVEGSLEAAEAALGQGRIVVFVLDQRHAAGIAVPFLGEPAWTSAAFAALAYRTGARVFASAQWRDAEGGIVARAIPVDWPRPIDRAPFVLEWTRRTQEWLGERVLERPGDWWWLHRRWKQGNPRAEPSG